MAMNNLGSTQGMHSFPIQPIERFKGSSTSIRRPKEIACFSYDGDHNYHPDDRSLRYYYPPKIGADLSKGFDSFRQLDDSKDDHLDSLLKTLINLEKETKTKYETDIVSWRGMMTKIMATPYDNVRGNGFEMNATRFQGTIFIEEHHQYKLEQRELQSSRPSLPGKPSQDLMSFWGYKFETLCLLPDTWDATPREFIENREEHPVSNHAQYCSVVKTGIGRIRMILGGEVDAVWDEKPRDRDAPINWLELKTSATVHNDRDIVRYERKLLKFWIQSFLLGVPKILVGFRSEAGILERLEQVETKSIPNLVKRNGKGSWDGNLCINFTAAFLDWLQNTISAPGVWRIRRQDGASGIEVFKYVETGSCDILSEEFLTWRLKRSAVPAEIQKEDEIKM